MFFRGTRRGENETKLMLLLFGGGARNAKEAFAEADFARAQAARLDAPIGVAGQRVALGTVVASTHRGPDVRRRAAKAARSRAPLRKEVRPRKNFASATKALRDDSLADPTPTATRKMRCCMGECAAMEAERLKGDRPATGCKTFNRANHRVTKYECWLEPADPNSKRSSGSGGSDAY